MGTKLILNEHKNLYSFWSTKLSDMLHKELCNHDYPYLINLASNEYSKAAIPDSFQEKLVTPVFKENKNDNYKVITVYAKKARGLMTRFIIENNITNPEEIKHFDSEGYGYSSELSTECKWVFTR